MRALLALTFAILVQIYGSQAATVSGPAVIVDGDTLWIGSQEVRIHGIDAPETAQRCQFPKGTWDCSNAAIAALTTMTEGKMVRCIGHESDQYGRLVARCSTDEVPDIGAKLVASGLASRWCLLLCSPGLTPAPGERFIQAAARTTT